MQKLDAAKLVRLGAPTKGGSQQIEDWLRGLLRTGTLRLDNGLFELRGPDPIVTSLNDLKQACGVAVETVKQGLRPLEMEHWVWLVDGAHTRLLGPPRFQISVTKENLWGSLSDALEVAITDGLNPLESVDYDRLGQSPHVRDCKRTLTLDRLHLHWAGQLRLADGQTQELRPQDELTLAAGSAVVEAGRSLVLSNDLRALYRGGCALRAAQPALARLPSGEACPLPAGTLLQLTRSTVVRRASGQTGILQMQCTARTAGADDLDWGNDQDWLSRFRHDVPLILVRRAVFADLRQVVQETCAGVAAQSSDRWRVVLGFHDCVLDGTIPERAGTCPAAQAPEHLLAQGRDLRETDSLREHLARVYRCNVARADVRIAPVRFASAYEKKWLRAISADAATNSELLSAPHRLPCWSQVGAYYQERDIWPWEVTREIYFTHVHLHYRQQ